VGAYFLDSSAVVKRYVDEIGTSWVNSLTDPAAPNDIYLATISCVEVVSAIARRRRAGSISTDGAGASLRQFRYDFEHQYQMVAITGTVIRCATDLADSIALRAYDAVQLAVLLELNHHRAALSLAPLAMISADHDLNAAAVAQGMIVDNPLSHP
jgi:predicted nucleic acid-binding protein